MHLWTLQDGCESYLDNAPLELFHQWHNPANNKNKHTDCYFPPHLNDKIDDRSSFQWKGTNPNHRYPPRSVRHMQMTIELLISYIPLNKNTHMQIFYGFLTVLLLGVVHKCTASHL